MDGHEENAGITPGRAGGLRDNIGNLKADLGRLRHDAGGAARDLAGVARTGVQEAGEYAREALDTVRARGADAVESTRGTIRENPLMSVGIAFGAGALLASLLRHL